MTKVCYLNVKTIESQNSNDRQHNDAPRWYENPQFLYFPPTEYLLNASSFNKLVFPDPWEEFYDKQNQNSALEMSSGGGGDDCGDNNDNTDHCGQSEVVVDAHESQHQCDQSTHHSNDNNNNSCSFDNASSGAQESQSQHDQHDGCTDYQHENWAPQQAQEQEQHHHSHHHHHHHHHDHDQHTSHESNPHTNEPSIIEQTNQSKNDHQEHRECTVPIEHQTSSVHETSESNDDQVRKTFDANTTQSTLKMNRKPNLSEMMFSLILHALNTTLCRAIVLGLESEKRK